jgi:hypothetical protein
MPSQVILANNETLNLAESAEQARQLIEAALAKRGAMAVFTDVDRGPIFVVPESVVYAIPR